MISLLAILISATAWNLERRNLVVPKFFDYLPAVCHEIDVDDLSHKEKAYVWCIVYYHFFCASFVCYAQVKLDLYSFVRVCVSFALKFQTI